MVFHMKYKALYNSALWLAVLAGSAFAQQQEKDLPAAPSAVATGQDQQQAPPPQQQPAPKAAAPKKDEPIFKSMPPRETHPEAAKPADLAPPPDASLPAKPAETTKSTTTPKANGPEPTPEETIRKEVKEVNVVFTVTDKHGNFIKGLTKGDFAVLDDHSPVKDIRAFSAQSDLPLRVGLLIDASSSIREQFKFEQESAIEFLNQIVRPKQDQAFVIGFDAVPEVTQNFTNSQEQLMHGVRMIRPSGGTALYDALFYAARDVIMKHRDDVNVRRAIILISDGDDNVSRVTREEAIEMAQRAEVIVYTISTNLSNIVDHSSKGGDGILERIAEATGGRSFHPFKIEDVANAFSDIQAELRSQYSMAYHPDNLLSDGRFHSIEISTPNKKQRVRVRKGYYAPKPASVARSGGQ
jgi:VWFA-related protein